MRKPIYACLAALAGLVFGGCQADMDTPELEIPTSALEANMTILDLKTAYEGQSVPVGYLPGTETYDADGNVTGGEHVIIKGRVISSDASGNIYKSLVLQDETAALAFSLNQSSMYVDYRLGQEVLVDMTGLNIGYYRGLQQVGAPGEPYSGEPQLGFMAYDYWLAHSERNGLPDPDCAYIRYGKDDVPADKMHCFVFNSFDEVNSLLLTSMQSQLVEFRNVRFEGAGELNYSDYQESANRTLIDVNNQTLTVRNSGYSNFYNNILPEGTGRVRGILSYYGDAWQLVLRDLADVQITEDGAKDRPYTVGQALNPENQGMSGWVTGYIVGSIKAGVSTVTSNADAIFGSDAEMDNNLLIASDPDEKDVFNCVVVELPQNSVFRYYGNLADNPEVYRRRIEVNGTIGEYVGMTAIVDNAGTKDSFEIEGVEPGSSTGDTPRPSGSGTEADPYNVSYVMESTADQNGVWVTGYVAGYVVSGDFSESTVEFSASEISGSTNYLNSTNVVLSAVAPMMCGVSNSVPCQLTAATRPTLGLRQNPSIFGRQVKIKCQITTYLGVRGIRNITEVTEL
ncbi:MAG: hypothetical protein K2L59_04720 [Muribaculaceae bacterium]|nr:hypothetical protein [Muribaculaceae bacterium]